VKREAHQTEKKTEAKREKPETKQNNSVITYIHNNENNEDQCGVADRFFLRRRAGCLESNFAHGFFFFFLILPLTASTLHYNLVI